MVRSARSGKVHLRIHPRDGGIAPWGARLTLCPGSGQDLFGKQVKGTIINGSIGRETHPLFLVAAAIVYFVFAYWLLYLEHSPQIQGFLDSKRSIHPWLELALPLTPWTFVAISRRLRSPREEQEDGQDPLSRHSRSFRNFLIQTVDARQPHGDPVPFSGTSLVAR